MWELTAFFPICPQACVWAIGKPQDTAPGVGKHSMRCRTARTGTRVPGPQMRQRSSDSQTFGHLVTARGHGRAENGVGAHRLDLAQGQGWWGALVDHMGMGEVLGMMMVGLKLGLGNGWEHKESFYRRLDCQAKQADQQAVGNERDGKEGPNSCQSSITLGRQMQVSACALYSTEWTSVCVKPQDLSLQGAEEDSCRVSLDLTEAKNTGFSPGASHAMLDTLEELRMKGESGKVRGSSLTLLVWSHSFKHWANTTSLVKKRQCMV